MKRMILNSFIFLCGITYANADPNNPQDMEKYVQQCPKAISEREAEKSVLQKMSNIDTKKTGDENQDLINTCKSYVIMKTELLPGLQRYNDALQECSNQGLPILKATVFNNRSTMQVLLNQLHQLDAMCN